VKIVYPAGHTDFVEGRMSDKPTQEIKWHSPTTDDLLASAEIDKTMLEVKLAARDLEVKALWEKLELLVNRTSVLFLVLRQANLNKEELSAVENLARAALKDHPEVGK